MIAVGTWRAKGLRHGGRLLVPVSRTVTVRLPGHAGGLVWNRPLGVEVRESGQRRIHPIPDWTRRLQMFLLGAGAAAAILLGLTGRHRKRRWRGGRV